MEGHRIHEMNLSHCLRLFGIAVADVKVIKGDVHSNSLARFSGQCQLAHSRLCTICSDTNRARRVGPIGKCRGDIRRRGAQRNKTLAVLYVYS